MSESAAVSLNPQVRSPHNPRIMMAKNPFPLPPMPMGWDEITKILPHRYPMLLVDKILELEPGHRVVGTKNVTATEEFFQGHFPGHPVMPGVLILESMAQVAGILILVTRNTPGALSYFAAVEKARWKKPVRPGDTVVTEATLDTLRGPYCKATVVGRVDGEIVVEGEYTFFTTTDSQAQTIIKSAGTTAIDTAQNGSPVATPKPIVAPVSANGAVKASAAKPEVHPTAIVDPKAELSPGVKVGPFCIIEEGVRLGENTTLESHVILKRGTQIGRNCRVFPHCVIGHEPQDAKYKGEYTRVIIGDNNIFREMVTIHRATGEGEATIIGHNNMFMAYVHLGHNCVVGDNNMISNSTGISGHVTIEDRCVIGGFVGIHQFVHIGKMAMIGGLSKVVQDVPPFCMADGRPAPIRGLNTRGMRRNGITSEERTQISAAFKLLYRSDLNTSQALERIQAEVPTSEPLQYLTSFIERVREGRLGRQDESPL
ncbi:acyl-ACP--UDP-N-acetylglucosamine O-acyltransferase [bacterium]|nr:MAG: acyl-ACP--UDP-N-acetylglucosamine O-acyltransferase [bacterium]